MAPMIDIDEAIEIATKNGGVSTITGKHGVPVAHIVTERRFRSLLRTGSPGSEDQAEKRKPTRKERRTRAQLREHREREAERTRKAQVTAQDNLNRARKLRGSKHGIFPRDLTGVGELQRDINRQLFSGGVASRQ